MVEQGDKTPCPYSYKTTGVFSAHSHIINKNRIIKMKYTEYKKYIIRKQELNTLKEGGIVFIKKRNIKKVLGLGCLVVAMLPNGLGLFLYPLSFMLLGMQGHEIKNVYLPELKRRGKYYFWGCLK